MTVNYKGTIVEVPPDEYRYITPEDFRPCYTIAGGHDAHCIVCLETPYAFWRSVEHRRPAATSAIRARKTASNGPFPPRSSGPRTNVSCA